MPPRGRPTTRVALDDDERAALDRLTNDEDADPEARLRARIVLASADGSSDVDVAQRLMVNRMTVAKWRQRFQAARLAGLSDDSRPGRPRVITADDIAFVLRATMAGRPPRMRWSRRLMSLRTGISMSTIGRIWREYGLEPHASLAPAGPDTFAPAVAVCGLYLSHLQQAVALCLRAGPGTGLEWPFVDRSPIRVPDEAEDPARQRLAQLVSLLDTKTTIGAPPDGPTFHDFATVLERATPGHVHIQVLYHGADGVPALTTAWLTQNARVTLTLFESSRAWKRAVGSWLPSLAEHLRQPSSSSGRWSPGQTGWSLVWADDGPPLVWIRALTE